MSQPSVPGDQSSPGHGILINGVHKPPSMLSLERTSDGRPRFHGCSRIREYEIIGKLGEGTFGEVHKARSLKRGNLVALKKILMHNEKDGFPITALREIKLLKMLSHPNILKLEEMSVEHKKGEGRKKAVMYMVTPYMDHDLSGLLENPAVRITEPQIKCYMLQLLEGLRYLHGQQILHRDMKAANLLINNKGILQIADFGLARPYDDPPPKPGRGGGVATREYTTLVVTRWYRPPELLLQLRRYTTAIDMWGVGCVFAEMFKGRPILAGTSDLNQIFTIFELVGSPTEENMPGWSELPGCEGVKSFKYQHSTLHQQFREQGSGVISLLGELLKLDWRKRINAIDALQHPYFKNNPLPAKPGELPQFEESHELDRRKFRTQAALPPAPAGGTVGIGPNGEWGNGAGHTNVSRRPPGPHAPPRNGYENRSNNYPGHHRGPGPQPAPSDRRPAWSTRDPGLPPRPPPSNSGWSWGADDSNNANKPRLGLPRGGAIHGAGPTDTYIPSYQNSGDVGRGRHEDQPRGERGRNGDRGGGYDAGRRRSRSPARPGNSNPDIRDRGDRDRETYRR